MTLLVSTIPARGHDFQTISLVGRVFSLRLVGRSSIKDELEYGNTSTKLKENNSGTNGTIDDYCKSLFIVYGKTR